MVLPERFRDGEREADVAPAAAARAAALNRRTLAAGAVYLVFRQDIRQVRTRVAAGSQRIQTARGPVEYADRGTDEPAPLNATAAGQADALAAFLDALGVERAAVVAMSSGGPVAMELAILRRPLWLALSVLCHGAEGKAGAGRLI